MKKIVTIILATNLLLDSSVFAQQTSLQEGTGATNKVFKQLQLENLQKSLGAEAIKELVLKQYLEKSGITIIYRNQDEISMAVGLVTYIALYKLITNGKTVETITNTFLERMLNATYPHLVFAIFTLPASIGAGSLTNAVLKNFYGEKTTYYNVLTKMSPEEIQLEHDKIQSNIQRLKAVISGLQN